MKGITADQTLHQPEHFLEVELIFLQKVLKDFRIVPILVNQTSEDLIDKPAQKLSFNLDDQTLLVVSSDLYHYPTWEIANQVDDQTIKAVLRGKKHSLDKTVKTIGDQGYPNLSTTACGHQALRIALKVAEILQIKNLVRLKYENLGDVTGDKNRVVGYAALGAWSEKVDPMAALLDLSAQKEALAIARNTLEQYFKNRQIPAITPQNQILSQPMGAFVTLRNQGELRGCLGEFEPQKPVCQVIQERAVSAATQDFRFPPVRPEELPDLKIEISVLSPLRKIKNWREIKLGEQGVVVQKGSQTGTFLPQVAGETGWSLEEFLSQLCSQKAGLPPDCYRTDPEINLQVFDAQVFEE